MLAEATGWKLDVRSAVENGKRDTISEAAGAVASAMHDPPESGEAEIDSLPCDFLGANGCTFPTDLRPFGCTQFICRYMHERLDRPTLTKIKRLVRELEANHEVLLRRLHPIHKR